MFLGDEPPGLTDADREAVVCPLATYEVKTCARWQADALRPRVPGYVLGRRLLAALVSGGWPSAQVVLDEIETRGLVREVLEAIAADAAVLALRAAGGDRDTASLYYETLLRHQEILDRGEQFQ